MLLKSGLGGPLLGDVGEDVKVVVWGVITFTVSTLVVIV